MSERNTNNGNGVTFATLLFLLFLGLKLTHSIDWSWWLVTAPLWGPIAIIFALLFLAALVLLVMKAFIYIKLSIDDLMGHKTSKKAKRNVAGKILLTILKKLNIPEVNNAIKEHENERNYS
jgi:hypothetical protein